jgi:hypothetical protein
MRSGGQAATRAKDGSAERLRCSGLDRGFLMDVGPTRASGRCGSAGYSVPLTLGSTSFRRFDSLDEFPECGSRGPPQFDLTASRVPANEPFSGLSCGFLMAADGAIRRLL